MPLILPGISTPFRPEIGAPRMRRQNQMTHDEVIAYNLRGGGHEFTEFESAQNDRVLKARAIIGHILDTEYGEVDGPPLIIEPGCSTGDISGFFGSVAGVVGIDVTPGAAEAARAKWPAMDVWESRIENIHPQACDILVLCEFLEHIIDPVGFLEAWGPLARYIVIGHPLVGDGNDPEPGHPWAYYDVDFANWFLTAQHQMMEAWTFPMGYHMVIGWGRHA